MLVSVIIPTYNAKAYIEECLASVIAQSYKRIEIVVVDDGSIDNTIELILDYPIKIIQQKNQGACVARNHGFFESSGDYIQFLDADDLLSPDKIELQIKQLLGKEDVISNGRWGRFYTDNPFTEDIKWGPHISLQKDHDPISWLCQNHMSQTACWLTPRKLIEKAGLWDESLTNNQDGEFFSRVVAQSRQVLYTPEAKVYYRSNIKTSISSKLKEENSLKSLFKTTVSFEKILMNLEDSERTRLACANKYQQFVYRAFPKCADLVKEAEWKIREYGGSSWPPYKGGRLFNFIQTSFGWKTAVRIREIMTP